MANNFERPYQDGRRPFVGVVLTKLPIIANAGKIILNIVERTQPLRDKTGFVTRAFNHTIKGESKSYVK